MAKIRIIARFIAKPGKESELRILLGSLVAPSRAEKGCEYYELFESNTAGRFYFNELWTSWEDIEAHGSTPPFQKFAEQVNPLLTEEFEVNFLTPVE